MDIEQQQQIRYDRQIRLWGDEGQSSIQRARICVFGSSALAAEILKSLVLAGIGSFHIIDDALMEESDLGQNFFMDQKGMGKYRGECLVQLLTELNPSVHGQHSPFSFKEFSKHDLQMLLQFSLVVGTNMSANEAVQLDHFLFDHNIPFFHTLVYGMLGYLRLSFREHIIWNNHSENDSYDLRLDSPFPELFKLATETNLDSMTHEQHSHTPYVLLCFKALNIWKERHQNNEEQMEGETDPTFPDIIDYKTRKEIEKILMEMRQPDEKGSLEEENFAEAARNLLKSMDRTKLPENVKKVLADPKAGPLQDANTSEESVSLFWILCAALREFIALNQHMPLSGQLPDMTSDSKRYAQLLGIYRSKSFADAALIHSLANKILKQRHSALSSQGRRSPLCGESPIKGGNNTQTANSETDESATETEETDEDDLSRMSTSEANEQRISLSVEDMDEDDDGRKTSESTNPEDNSATVPINRSRLETIAIDQCQSFCKNASKIGIQYGSSLSSEFTCSIKSILQRIGGTTPEPGELPPPINPLVWYILLRAVDRFRSANGRLPLENSDLRDLKRCLAELFAETKDPALIAAQNEFIPADILEEICRFGAAEPHVIAAILGGCVAQEAIKLCTHQYTPADNSLLFDGHSQQATTFRVDNSNKQQ